jgi:hypothetical protein
MRAKQRKLLGILGALAVPIALVVGLYTDSGDLFKGYLTFEEPAADIQANDTTVRGYLEKVINGEYNSETDSVTDGVFHEYFQGIITNAQGDKIFDSEQQCVTGTNDVKNLEDQYETLTGLLQDRSNEGFIQTFQDIKIHYNTEFEVGQKLLKDPGLQLEVGNNPSFVSYEDIQKLILVNFMAYKTADCTDGIEKYHDSNNDIIALNDLQDKLFAYDINHQERQISKTTLLANPKIVTSHLIASTEAIGNPAAGITLRNDDQIDEFTEITTEQTAMQDKYADLPAGANDFLALNDRTKYSALNAEFATLKTLLDNSDLNSEHVDGDKLNDLEGYFNKADALSTDGDLAFDVNEKATAYVDAVDALKVNLSEDEGVMNNILGFNITAGLTSDMLNNYIAKINLAEAGNAFGDDDNAILIAVNALDADGLSIAKTELETAKNNYAFDQDNQDLLLLVAEKQATYLLTLQKSLNEQEAPTEGEEIKMLKDRAQLMLSIANLAKLVLEEGTSVRDSIATHEDAPDAIAGYLEIDLQNPQDFASIDFDSLIEENITDTQSTFGSERDGSSAPAFSSDTDYKDPSNGDISDLEGLFNAVAESQTAFADAKTDGTLFESVQSPFNKLHNALNEIIAEIDRNTTLDFQQTISDELAIDMRAGSFASGGFPETLTIETDLRDARVDVALIQVEGNNSNIPVVVSADTIALLVADSTQLLGVNEQQQRNQGSVNFKVNYSQDSQDIDGFSTILDLSGLNAPTRNFRSLQEENQRDQRINVNHPQVLLVKIDNIGSQEHNFAKKSRHEHLVSQYQIYVFADSIDNTVELATKIDDTIIASRENVIGENIELQIKFDNGVNLPNEDTENNSFLNLVDQDDDCANEDDLKLEDLPANIVNGEIQFASQLESYPNAGTYSVCFAIYDDNFADTNEDITFVETEQLDPADEGAADVSEDEITDMPDTPADATSVSLRLEGNELSTDQADYQLVTTGDEGNATVVKTAEDLQSESDVVIVSFGEVAPGTYKLRYKDAVQDGFVNVDEHKVLNPANNSTIGVSNPKITFECLDSYTYTAILTNLVDNSQQTFENIDCQSNIGDFTVEQALDKGARYEVQILAGDLEFDNHFESHRFTTSNNFLLTSDQVKVLDFTCGRQIEESRDANGVPIPGKRNVVIKGTTTNCAVLNPFPLAGISAGYTIKIGASTPQTDAVGLQAIQGGFAATSIPVPATGTDYYIYVLVPGENEFIKTNSFVTPYESNASTNTDRAEGDIDELVEISMPNTIEIGERVDLEIDIPENLDVHMMVVRYEGNQDDRDTRDFNGPVFIYCQDDITDHFEKSRDRRKIDRICEDFYEDDILEGPDTIEIEDFDTSRIGAEGDYDIIVDLFVDESTLPAELASKSNSNTAYAQSVVIKQLRVRVEEAFEAEDRELGGHSGFVDGRAVLASGVNFGYQPMHTAIPVQTQQCQTVFRDLNSSHQICKDIMYLYEQKLYTGVRMGNNVVSGVSQPAVRAHLFAFIDRVLKNYRRVPNYGVNYQSLSRFQDVRPYLNDPSQQWWLSPLSTLTTYGFVRGDGNNNVNPFGRVTQAQAAKLIGMATGLIPAELQQRSPWYADIVAQYISYGMNLNPSAPATMGDLVVILSRSIQIMKNPNLFNNINQHAGYTSVGLY